MRYCRRFAALCCAAIVLPIPGTTTAQSASSISILQTGRCSPAAQVRQALADAGQQAIIIGNRTGYGYPTSLIFFSNRDGSQGYLIRGDEPLGKQAVTACVDSVFANARLNDISRPGIPAWAMIGGDRAKAESICQRDKLGYQAKCNFHDDSILALNANGQRFMFSATGTAINPRDKSVRQGQRLTITLHPGEAEGLVKASTVEGSSYLLSAYTSVRYTQHGESMLIR